MQELLATAGASVVRNRIRSNSLPQPSAEQESDRCRRPGSGSGGRGRKPKAKNAWIRLYPGIECSVATCPCKFGSHRSQFRAPTAKVPKSTWWPGSFSAAPGQICREPPAL